MSWTSTAAAILEIRSIIFDGPTDKYCSFKKVLGTINGTNTTFKTLENRRVTNFTTATGAVLGVFKNGALIPSNKITSDDPASGTFVLDATVLPSLSARDVLTATYYYQSFLDADLDQFLQNASSWLGQGKTYINLVDGLNAAALKFAAQEAYSSLAVRMSMSDVYKLEDAPKGDELLKKVEAYKALAKDFMDAARDMRDDYWTRQGQSLAPNFAFSLGAVRDPTPRR